MLQSVRYRNVHTTFANAHDKFYFVVQVSGGRWIRNLIIVGNSICWLGEKNWGVPVRITPQLTDMGCVILADTIDAVHRE